MLDYRKTEKQMKFHRSFMVMLIVACTLVMTACGFQLRGYGSAKATMPFTKIYIDFADQSVFATQLRRHLRSNDDVQIVTNPKEAEVLLLGISESRRREILSLNSQGRVREFSLIFDLQFQVKDNKGKVLLAPTLLSLRRTLTFNENEALSKEGEESMLYRDMESDAVQQILRRLSAMKMTSEQAPSPEKESPAPTTPK